MTTAAYRLRTARPDERDRVQHCDPGPGTSILGPTMLHVSAAAEALPQVKDPVDAVPPAPQLAVLGLQHVLAFYAGAVIVPLVIAQGLGLSAEDTIHLINADLFTCGIASIIQSAGLGPKIGVRLPLLQGVTFTAVSPIIAIGLASGGGIDGLAEVYGSIIVAGLVTFFAAPYFAKLLRFFPPVVTGTLLTVMGTTLLGVAASDVMRWGTTDPSLAGNRRIAIVLLREAPVLPTDTSL